MSPVRQLRVMSSTIEEGWMATSIKAAFASSDLKRVDQHFGAAAGFVLYAVDPHQAHLVEVVQFDAQDMDGTESKLMAKLQALEGCVAVYCQAVGSSAIHQLRARGIQPVKVAGGARIADLVHDLQTELRDGPGVWLARAIDAQRPRADGRFDAMEAEGWEE
jgi:nitrogen fixation protein NifX